MYNLKVKNLFSLTRIFYLKGSVQIKDKSSNAENLYTSAKT
jgi:tRNA G26 N,N-dimethylase Trm1